jgi:hypothetical protein
MTLALSAIKVIPLSLALRVRATSISSAATKTNVSDKGGRTRGNLYIFCYLLNRSNDNTIIGRDGWPLKLDLMGFSWWSCACKTAVFTCTSKTASICRTANIQQVIVTAQKRSWTKSIEDVIVVIYPKG